MVEDMPAEELCYGNMAGRLSYIKKQSAAGFASLAIELFDKPGNKQH
jgi:hypothetical protein